MVNKNAPTWLGLIRPRDRLVRSGSCDSVGLQVAESRRSLPVQDFIQILPKENPEEFVQFYLIFQGSRQRIADFPVGG